MNSYNGKNPFLRRSQDEVQSLPVSLLFCSIFFAGVTLACHSKPSSSEAPSANQPPVPEDTPVVEQGPQQTEELAALPEMIIAEVSLDDHGQPIPGTGTVKTLNSAAAIADGASAAQSWDAAQSADIPTDELETSTSSWSPIPRRGNHWDQFRPSYKTSSGQCYAYGQGQSYAHGNKRYYVFQRPNLASYNTHVTVPLCGAYGGYQPYPQAPSIPGPGPQGPQGPQPPTGGGGYPQQPGFPQDPYDGPLRAIFDRYGVRPLNDADYLNESDMVVALGERLFHDKLLSAKNDISCATCHIERRGTSDGWSLGPVGDVLGGRKRGPFGVGDLLPRNAPHLFNLGHKSYKNFFWDGRVEAHPGFPSNIKTSAGEKLPEGLHSPLAAQVLFPLIAEKEMGCGMGPEGQSPDEPLLWQNIIDEVLNVPAYRQAFRLAYPGQNSYGIEHLANAIAAFESKKWRTVQSRFDQYLAGDMQALSPEEKQGAVYFYTKGNCAQCHSGPLLTDHGYHNIAIPQFGPGAGDGHRGLEDWGRGRVTNRQQDRYRFKTPSLRNVSRTGPWGHNGAYNRLEDFVDHYRTPIESFEQWNLNQVILPQGFQPHPSYLGAWHNPQARQGILTTREVNGVPLSPQEIQGIMKFLYSLNWEQR